MRPFVLFIIAVGTAFAVALLTGCTGPNGEYEPPLKGKKLCMIWAGTFAVPIECGGQREGESDAGKEDK